MRRHLAAALAVSAAWLLLLDPAPAEASDRGVFADSSAGVAIAVPNRLFPLSSSGSDATIALTSADEHALLELRVVREERFGPESFAQRQADFAVQRVRITTRQMGDGFFLLAGISADGYALFDYSSTITGPACEGCLARLSISYPVSERGRYEPAARAIAESLRRTADLAVGAAEAERLAAGNPDVARWRAQVRAAGGSPVLSASGTIPDRAAPCIYEIHAYQQLADSRGELQTRTFGWYDANVCLGSVSRQAPE